MFIDEDYTIKVKTKSRLYNLDKNSMDITNEYPMSENQTDHEKLTKTEYTSIGSSRKLNLLLQRSLRYSYRQRCCGCCPTILCELLFPLIIIGLLALARYGTNALIREMNGNSDSNSRGFGGPLCSQNINTTTTILSKDLFTKCFKFPPSYKGRKWSLLDSNTISNKTNIIFQPMTNETNELVILAKTRLTKMNCKDTKIWSQNINDGNDTYLLQNEIENTIIIDFGSTSNLKTERNLDYNIMVRASNVFIKNAPVDMSFISFLHPTFIPDRSNVTGSDNQEGSELPEFTDVKMFIDSLLIDYQINKTIEFELERSPITCTPVRRDSIFESGSILVTTILIMIDFIFLIPYLILLISLIREKNAKVKEILKVLGIEPILNNFAQAIRTLIILCLFILLLCIVYKLKLKPDAYFNTVNFGILFIGYLILGLQLISFCIMNVQLFDKNVRAILGTFLIYLISLIVFSYSIVWPTGIQYVLIFFSPYIAGHSLFQQAILHDLAKIDVSLFRTIYYNVPMYFPTLIIMIFSCIFYWVLSWYLEKVFPGIYGIPLEWNFLFKRDYWCSEKIDYCKHSFSNSNTSNSIGKPIVHIYNLVKKFGPDKIAVNDVSFNLYENQITSLLGPNGSGKTTIFNCLIGIYKQTSGRITIENEDGIEFDTQINIDMLRKSMGYCPQHDILFDLLTIKEQLEFYAIARGFEKNKKKIVKEMLYLVNLQNSKDLYCNSLSGGMKRRLSLACAFIGDTKIVLLDEPSSGLDPSNRRLLWDWLRSMKEGKTLLLTTHFMEESDALSDRIIIIANGNIKVDGTSAKLKEQHGSGYKLVINKQHNYHTNDIKNELYQYLPKLKIETDISDGDVVFRTNQQPNEQFVQALYQLEIMKKENRIKNYGVQNSTMDDVFLKITRETKNDNESNSTSIDIDKIDKQCHDVFNDRHFLTGISYHLNQCYGLIIKTSLVRYRRWALTFIILLLPILYNLLSNLIFRSGNDSGIFKMNLNSLNPQTIIYHTDPIIEKYFRASIDGSKLEQGSANITEMNQQIWQKRMKRPYTYTDIYLGFNIPKPIGDKYTIQTLSSNLISGHEIISLASNTFYKYILNDTSASIQTTLIYKNTGNFTAQVSVGILMNLLSTASCFLKLLPISLLLDVFIFYIFFFYTTVFLISERKDSFLSLLNISGLHPASYWLFSYLFDIIISVIWFCYLLAIYCIIDIAFHGVPNKKPHLETMIPLEFASPWNLRIQFYPLTILITLPTLPFVYLLTKFFRSDILGGITICFLLIVSHFISIIIPVVTMIIENTFIRKILYWLFNLISPTINSQVIITYILAKKSRLCRFITDPFGLDDPALKLFKALGDDTIQWNIGIIILHILLFFLILIIIDSGLLQISLSCLYKSNFNENQLDDDVLVERHRILNNEKNSSNNKEHIDYLTVNNLVKYYPIRKILAVNHLTFGARRGEAFGLLGYNGAGKTTTFRIIVGDLMSTQGTAYIDGQNVHRRIRSTRHLGYCPQENCSMSYLTVHDSLYLLARIRGIKSSRIKSIVQTISSLFLLDPFLNNYIHELSGGTKRRLHTAIALIGPPLVAILDEPTTGVDPHARQQMQEIFLNAVKAKLTIILTSHSMDECERVCNRLGIMVHGQLACLGTIQHLKSKFGQGYTIEIKVRSIDNDINATAIQNVQSFLLSQKQYHIEIKETTQSTGVFQIEHSTPAELFQLLEENKQQLNIETYTISQTTLEQIFLSFGKQIRATTG
ncbi:unnamed protein product [Rotaria sordida]|uniref:ABC transporter domain-containing protein n=1 Tax=Rotaria sordida TaxID=392033 RepID=A0A814HL71_9BILA|nr:unnamed protein product [Rotaria sordida]CAF1256880.1 unnamed protein product [Rotaria sordida]